MSDHSVPEKMQAAQITKFGGPEVLVVKEVPVPSRAPGEVLVKVVATSINPIDVKSRDGSAFPYLQPRGKVRNAQKTTIAHAFRDPEWFKQRRYRKMLQRP